MTSMPDGILFDAYGTLFDLNSLHSIAEELYPGRGAALTALWRQKQLEYSRLRTLCDQYLDFAAVTRDALIHSCARLLLQPTEQEYQRLLGQYARLALFPDVLVTLERLNAAGIRLAILSNGTLALLESAVRAAGMSGMFTAVLSAESVRKFKTAPEVYGLGVAAFNCPAERLLFVSGNGWDACCATWFGYRTLWVNRSAEPAEQLGILPTAEARSLQDVIAFVGLTQPGGKSS
jgi:2-haloacid dehalogenase